MSYVLAVTECSGRAGSVMVTRGGRVGVGSGGSCLGWEGRGGRCLEWSGTEEQVSPGVPVTDDREEGFLFGECFSKLLHNRGVSPRI